MEQPGSGASDDRRSRNGHLLRARSTARSYSGSVDDPYQTDKNDPEEQTQNKGITNITDDILN